MSSQFSSYKMIFKDFFTKIYDTGDKLVVHKIPVLTSNLFLVIDGLIFFSGFILFGVYFFISSVQSTEGLFPILISGFFDFVVGLVLLVYILMIFKQRSAGDGVASCDSVFSIKTEVGGEIFKQSKGLNENIGKFDDLKVGLELGGRGSPILVFYCQDKRLFSIRFNKIIKSFFIEKGINVE